jgi:hypothetical protein
MILPWTFLFVVGWLLSVLNGVRSELTCKIGRYIYKVGNDRRKLLKQRTASMSCTTSFTLAGPTSQQQAATSPDAVQNGTNRVTVLALRHWRLNVQARVQSRFQLPQFRRVNVVLKFSRAISSVNAELKTDFSEISCLHHQGRCGE